MGYLRKVRSSRNRRSAEYVADDVAYLTIGFVNVYFIGTPGGRWVLVDSGLPGTAPMTARVAAELYGTPPQAIILTHGHVDHSGAVQTLAEIWEAPVYAHPLELPYLTGLSHYPPKDSSMGGAIAHVARVLPDTGIDVGDGISALPANGTVPGLRGWRWVHTPGHTPGHIALFRDDDRVLIAGDAVATMPLDSWIGIAAEAAAVDRPPAPFTTDWQTARDSVRSLFELRPLVLAAGHGVPLHGREITPALRGLANNFPIPRRGRYVSSPATADETGVLELPPPVRDPFPGMVAAAALGAFGGVMLVRRS